MNSDSVSLRGALIARTIRRSGETAYTIDLTREDGYVAVGSVAATTEHSVILYRDRLVAALAFALQFPFGLSSCAVVVGELGYYREHFVQNDGDGLTRLMKRFAKAPARTRVVFRIEEAYDTTSGLLSGSLTGALLLQSAKLYCGKPVTVRTAGGTLVSFADGLPVYAISSAEATDGFAILNVMHTLGIREPLRSLLMHRRTANLHVRVLSMSSQFTNNSPASFGALPAFLVHMQCEQCVGATAVHMGVLWDKQTVFPSPAELCSHLQPYLSCCYSNRLGADGLVWAAP